MRTVGNIQRDRGAAAQDVNSDRVRDTHMSPSNEDEEVIITVPADMQAGVWANWAAINESDRGFTMHIAERWEYLKVTAIPAGKVDSVRDAYALVGYEEAERSEGEDGFDLTVRKEMNVSQQLSID